MINRSKFINNALTVDFETTPAFIKSVLPPYLEMPREGNYMSMMIENYRSTINGDFNSSLLNVSCHHPAFEHDIRYMLVLYINNTMADAMGREMWGEPKKEAVTSLHFNGDDVYAFIDRRGKRIVEINAKLGPELKPEGCIYYSTQIKCPPTAPFKALEEQPPIIFTTQIDMQRYRYREAVSGNRRMNGSKWDPVDQVPILNIRKIHLSEQRSNTRIHHMAQLPGSRYDYYPYLFGTMYDRFELFSKPGL